MLSFDYCYCSSGHHTLRCHIQLCIIFSCKSASCKSTSCKSTRCKSTSCKPGSCKPTCCLKPKRFISLQCCVFLGFLPCKRIQQRFGNLRLQCRLLLLCFRMYPRYSLRCEQHKGCQRFMHMQQWPDKLQRILFQVSSWGSLECFN